MHIVIKRAWAGLRGVVAMVGLVSCGGGFDGATTPGDLTPGAPKQDHATLQGAWTLLSLQEAGAEATPVPERRFLADFGPDKDLFIKADCNVCTAAYTATLDGSLEVMGPFPCTLAYCVTAPLDTQYVALLGAAQSWSVSDETLELSSEGGVLRFERTDD